MTEKDRKKLAEEIAIFRYEIIADLARRPLGSKRLSAELARKAGQTYTVPGSSRTHFAAETIRDWLKLYHRGGFDALLPGTRKDAGQARALSRKLIDLLVETKEENPELTVQQVIDRVQAKEASAKGLLHYSTVHRHLAHAGSLRTEREPTRTAKTFGGSPTRRQEVSG